MPPAPAPAEEQAGKPFSLTSHLLATTDPATWQAATQAPFLRAAGEGRLPKRDLALWLANDRLYVHAYMRAVGCLLSLVDVPPVPPPGSENGDPAVESQIVDWLCDALAGVRREERWFVDAARRYGLELRLPGAGAKLPGLPLYERLFEAVGLAVLRGGSPPPCAWLEGGVLLWATEKCYLEAWTWARSLKGDDTSPSSYEGDADGGAARKEFIDNWSSDDFRAFVDRFRDVLDRGVREYISGSGGEVTPEAVVVRVQSVWDAVLQAEIGFWPVVE
ncbi:uncharacterized protein E0L32_003150 [Thyridium curvatum]|uniref:Thiaminase-2/PQQC domain-containing protein n=1 Tax=Thyridium curvatum TaxID=1093900 RepID=A0A507BC77_9PEZI|nr:uncharacterized protein E0L32_003150 [Thyridium curvatum]TPX17507.1 hypothetical protein E0L32_003150 [Thyridium curvatum]